MKKLMMVFALVLLWSCPAFACAHEEKGMKGHYDMDDDDEMMEHMHAVMGKASMVATEDGGVIVLMGDKLYKYDRSLTLVKTVEVGKPACCVMEGKKMCPLHGKTMDKKDCPMKAKSMDKDCPMMKKTGEVKSIEVKSVVPAPKQNFGPK